MATSGGFWNWFDDVDETPALLHATDVFLTRYLDAEQIVSGALPSAIAAGFPFVSTPYRHAAGLAAQGCGLTVPFGGDDALAGALVRAPATTIAIAGGRRGRRRRSAGWSTPGWAGNR